MALACVLLCLTLFSVYLVGGIYAKYTVRDNASDSARVAKFDISKSGAYFDTEFEIGVVPGDVTRTFTVQNKSETDVNYTVKITNTTNNIPYSFSVNDDTPAKSVYTKTLSIDSNSTADIEITASWDKEGAFEYMGKLDLIKIEIVAEQKD